MLIKTIKVGSLRTNCYILADEQSQEAVIIDPGDEAELLWPKLAGLTLKLIIITHGHFDHVGAINVLRQKSEAKMAAHIGDPWFGKPDVELNDGDEIKFGSQLLKVIYTPGHSSGSISLYTPGHLFSGDTLFLGTCGRTDLPGSSERAMVDSLNRLAQLPDETIVHPGHGQETTIGAEKGSGLLG
jgi:glyoxylase-like metal-dependent hydrolase (beta-lactamase superfamily II)